MAYSIFLGTHKNRCEIQMLELEESSHSYIFERNEHLMGKDSRLYRISNYYRDVTFFYEDIEVLAFELDQLIQDSNDNEFVNTLISIRKICIMAMVNKKNIYCFCD
jgi:hypothetical protein